MSGDNFDPRSPPQDIEWIRNLSFQFFLKGDWLKTKHLKQPLKKHHLDLPKSTILPGQFMFSIDLGLGLCHRGCYLPPSGSGRSEISPRKFGGLENWYLFSVGPEPILINGVIRPLWMAKNNWVISVTTPISGVITYLLGTSIRWSPYSRTFAPLS